jgi:hypothetical protein
MHATESQLIGPSPHFSQPRIYNVALRRHTMLLFQQNPAAWDITFSPFAGGGKGTWGPCMSLYLLSIYLIFTPPTVIPAGNSTYQGNMNSEIRCPGSVPRIIIHLSTSSSPRPLSSRREIRPIRENELGNQVSWFISLNEVQSRYLQLSSYTQSES